VPQYEVEVERVAAKALTNIARSDATRIVRRLEELATDPRPDGVVKLTSSDAYRIRVGDYRVIYLIDDTLAVITVTRIAHRREAYRR
jgi:mRNA interferase RelE/StbE